MKYTLSIGLFSVLLLMGASCGKTADTNTNDTAATLANATATVNTAENTTEVTEVNTNTAANVNTTAGVTVTANQAEAGLEEPAAESNAFSLSDIAKHNTKADCWTAISGKVYDVSKYIARHPGGQVITQACGKDGTQLFATQGGEGQHSGTARSQLATFEIGTLK